MKKCKKYYGTKKNIPYPKLTNIRQNQKYANLLYDNLAGESGELSAIAQYTYENIELGYYQNFSKIILSIAMEEMHHFELIGNLIRKLGRRAYFIDQKHCLWSAKNVKYHFNSVYDMLSYNIESEKQAIAGYKEAIKHTQNKSIQQLLERIILDEQTHLEIFNRLR